MASTEVKYQIVNTTFAGRALVATCDIPQNEIILTDNSSVIAPITQNEEFKNSLHCVSCFRILNEKTPNICPRCVLPVCDVSCADSKSHSDDCHFFASFQVNRNEDFRSRFYNLMPCLGASKLIRLMRDKNHPVSSLVSGRESSYELYPWEAHIVETLTKSHYKGGFSKEEVIEALGIFGTNGVKVLRSKFHAPCVALFPLFSMANHSCICTAMYNAEFCSKEESSNEFRIELRAQNAIRKGWQITIRYLDLLLTTPERKNISRQKWNFVCSCPRCRDPSEKKTFSSGIRCNHCSSGYLLPNFETPQSVNCIWVCSECDFEIENDSVQKKILLPIQKSKSDISKNVSCDEDTSSNEESDEEMSDGENSTISGIEEDLENINKVEKWLFDTSKALHVNHVWILEVEFQLAVAYSRIIEQIVDEMEFTKPKLRPMRERLVQLVMHLLEVFTKLDPGSTRWRGMLMQKLVQPWMEIAKQDHMCRAISEDVFKQRVFFGMFTAREAVQCLRFYSKKA